MDIFKEYKIRSVKDLKIIKGLTESELGEGIFTFSDRYSVFDWGEMPNEIPGKGAALCMMAAYNFEMLEEEGIPTHYIGLLNSSKNIIRTCDLTEPSDQMVIKLSRVIEPEFLDGQFDYNFFVDNKGKLNNFVIPLEVLYRRGAPLGSSLFKKIKELESLERTEDLKLLLSTYGLTQKPKPGDLFPKIGYDFTTKFESTDRRLTDDEAYGISGLSEEQFGELEDLRNKVVELVSGRAHEVGFVDYDGKLEFIFFNGVMLADVAGTFDENRFMFNGEQLSKEFLRQYYKNYQPAWCEACDKAKEDAKIKGVKDWKSLVEIQPMRLPFELVDLVGEMYMSGSDKYTGLDLFKTRPLREVMGELSLYKN